MWTDIDLPVETIRGTTISSRGSTGTYPYQERTPFSSAVMPEQRGCVFYSLACSCRLHKINFFEYLTNILNRADILQHTASPEAYRDILPDRWKKSERAKNPAFLMSLRHPGDTYLNCLIILISYVVSNVIQDNKLKINTIDKNDNISFCYLQIVSYLYDRLDRC